MRSLSMEPIVDLEKEAVVMMARGSPAGWETPYDRQVIYSEKLVVIQS